MILTFRVLGFEVLGFKFVGFEVLRAKLKVVEVDGDLNVSGFV